jgi:hypothetical protein
MWLLDGLFTSLWRRIYGEGQFTGLIGNRTFQAVIYIIVQTFFWYQIDHNLWFDLIASIWVYAMFWSKAIGCILDCGEAWWQTHKDYNRWWTKPLNWIVHLFGGHKYQGMYDFWWMICRYTLCLLPLIYWGHYIWVAGLLSAPIYFAMKKLFEKNPNMYKVFDDSKDLSELIFGFTTGVIFFWGW